MCTSPVFFKMHFAARTHTQRSKGAVGPTVDYRPQGEALMAGAWRGPSDGYGPGKTKRLIFMCTSPVFFQNAAWHWMLEIICQGKQFRANWGQEVANDPSLSHATSQQHRAKKRKLLARYFFLKTLSNNFSGKAVPGNPITDNADHGKPRTTNPFFSSILLEWKAASNW